jgi:hypothetical protein
MKLVAFVFVLSFLGSGFAKAAQVYGSFKDGNTPVGAGIEVKILCAGTTYQGFTDNYGSYNIYTPQTGRCTLTVNYMGQSPAYDVHSYDDPVRYDFELVKGSDGTYSLMRR